MDYQLKPLGKTCAATGKPLAPGSICHSVVVERDGQLVRLDYSEEAWNGPPEHVVGCWQTRVPQPKQPQHVDPDALMRYFEQLCDEHSPSQDVNRYVSALLLLKLKRLALDDVRTDEDGDLLQLSGVRGEGVFEVRRLNLPDAELAALQQSLRTELAAEWAA